MSATTNDAVVPLPAPTTRELLRAGRRALKEVPGTRRLLFQGFLLSYAMSLLLAVAMAWLAYHFLVSPALAWAEQWGAGQGTVRETLATLLRVMLWAGEVIVILASQVVAFLLTLSSMGLWFEALVEKVVRFRRADSASPGQPRSVLGWLKSMGGALADSAGLVALSLFALVLGLVPVVGPLVAFALNSYLMGREVRDPYVSVRAALGDRPRRLVKGRRGWTIRCGVVPVIVAMVPVAGWLLMPVMMVYLSAGLAWEGEDAVRRAAGSVPESGEAAGGEESSPR